MKNLTTYAMTTVAARPTHVEQRTVAPVATLRTWGEVCPSHVGHGLGFSSAKGGDVVIADERDFRGTRAWSPPGC